MKFMVTIGVMVLATLSATSKSFAQAGNSQTKPASTQGDTFVNPLQLS